MGTERGIAIIWTARVPLIGMVHLLPLPGAPGWRGPWTRYSSGRGSDRVGGRDHRGDGRGPGRDLASPGTGSATDPTDLEAVRAAVPDAPILVGSGVTPENAASILSIANGAIIGSSVMVGGVAGAGVDPERAQKLVEAALG